MPLDPSVFVHERALCEAEYLGPRTRLWAFAQVQVDAHVGSDCNLCGHVFVETGARIGDRVTVKNGVQVWDGVVLEDEVFVGPNATFTNDPYPRVAHRTSQEDWRPTRVCRGATIGANATIVCGVTLGEDCFVAAGAVVTEDALPHSLVAGCPARRIGWVCFCGRPLSDALTCECGRCFEMRSDEAGLVEKR
jgi:serine acetyltransferase